MKNVIIVLAAFFCLKAAQAQVDHRDYSAWNAVVPKVKISDKVSALTEFHRRSTHFYSNVNQLVIRPRIDYKVSETTTIGLGYTWFELPHPSPQIDLNENNIYQNVKFKQKTKFANLTHQIRIEERFIGRQKVVNNTYIDDGTKFLLRSRYRFTAEKPIAQLGEKSKLSIVAFDELMINMSNQFRPQNFNQNWIFIAPKLKLNESLTITSGYLDIYVKSGNGYNGNSVWSSSLSLNLN